MSPRNEGAAPEVEMAIVQSDVHHLREQGDLDRRRFAQRLNEDRARLERMDAKLGAQGQQLALVVASTTRLERVAEAQQQTQVLILQDIHKSKGALKVLSWLLGSGIAFEVITKLVEHAR